MADEFCLGARPLEAGEFCFKNPLEAGEFCLGAL